ncbi:MAG: winged helix-turn-helix transcriptional regulator [Candidatus Aenigmarchaeota archaeon]|nr:winged helix-turn-helix transcriptional regulator [Candidatus Aenigmarchaeota archaeon]
MTNLYKKKGNHVPDKIMRFVKRQESVTISSIAQEFNLSRNTVFSYLSRMENRGELFRVQRGVYVSSDKLRLKPFISSRIKKINDHIRNCLPYMDFVIWSTENISQFAHDLITKHCVFIEAPRENVKAIMDVCSEKKWQTFMFKSINQDVINTIDQPILIIEKRDFYGSMVFNNIRTATVEKVVVDLVFFATRKKHPLHGREISRILYNILQTKKLNMSLLKRYATRRNVMSEMTRIFSKLYERYKLPQLNEHYEKEKSLKKILSQISGEY